MEKDRSRGIKHIKDKKKYKGNTVKNPKYVPIKSTQPNLGTNRDRYESEEEDEHEHKLSSSTDYALLSNVPISTGSHSELQIDKTEEDIISRNKLFCLDLDLLQKSILTIPFYERLSIDKEYFEESEIDQMEEEARRHLISFNEEFMKNTTQNSKSESNVPKDSIGKHNSIPATLSDDDIDNVFEITKNCVIEQKTNVTKQIQAEDHSEQDLEQWLDDILGD